MARTLGEGAWSWFADPRAGYFSGRHRRTSVGWIDRDGDVVVASFDHDSRTVERAVLRRDLGVDDHNNPGLLVDRDGRVTAFYCAHNAGHMYYRRARRSEDVSAWGPEHTFA